MIASLLSGQTVVESLAIPMQIAGEVGSQGELRASAGLDANSLITRVSGRSTV